MSTPTTVLPGTQAYPVPTMFASRAKHLSRVDRAVSELGLPPAIWKTCPWEPRELVETGLRQWLRCAGVAMLDHQVIGMPSRAVDEAWHGLILCTNRYAGFCDDAYGRFLHHHPEGDRIEGEAPRPRRRGAPVAGTMEQQLARTVAAWSLVAHPGEECVLWNLDRRIGVPEPWGVDIGTVVEVDAVVGPPR